MTSELSINRTTEEQQWILLQTQCKAWLASKLLPPTVSDVAKALTIVMVGKELGVPPLTSLREINIVQGKPCFSSQLMMALVYQKVPGSVINFVTPTEKQNTECTVEVSRPGGKEQRFQYTIEMAKAAGLLGKTSWKNYPEAMLRARAVASAVRAVFPDALSSCYLPEELEIESGGGSPMEGSKEIDEQRSLTQNSGIVEIDRKENIPVLTGNTVGYDQRHEKKMSEPCTEPQRKKLYAMTHALGFSNDESKEWLLENFDVESSKDLTKKQMNEAFLILEDLKKHEGGA